MDELAKIPEKIRVSVLQQLAARRVSPVPHVRVLPPALAAQPGPPVAPGRAPVVTNTLSRTTVTETVRSGNATKPVSIAQVVYSSTTNLPENVTVSIIRKGTNPAKIMVKKDEQSWEVSDKKFEQAS